MCALNCNLLKSLKLEGCVKHIHNAYRCLNKTEQFQYASPFQDLLNELKRESIESERESDWGLATNYIFLARCQKTVTVPHNRSRTHVPHPLRHSRWSRALGRRGTLWRQRRVLLWCRYKLSLIADISPRVHQRWSHKKKGRRLVWARAVIVRRIHGFDCFA